MQSYWKKPRAKLPSGIVTPESVIQTQCQEYLEIRRITYFHLPDGIFGFVASAPAIPSWFRAWFMKAFAARPDIVFDLPVKDHYSLSFRVELKTAKGRTHGPQTREVAAGRWALCRSLDEFVAVVTAAERLAERMRI